MTEETLTTRTDLLRALHALSGEAARLLGHLHAVDRRAWAELVPTVAQLERHTGAYAEDLDRRDRQTSQG